jgi:hypothetical protein
LLNFLVVVGAEQLSSREAHTLHLREEKEKENARGNYEPNGS